MRRRRHHGHGLRGELKRRVHVLGTGGTIAGAQPDPAHHGYKTATYGIDWLLNAVPGLDRLALLTGEQVVNIGSQDMDDATWLRLARRLHDVLATDETDAVLITHGTDTLEETSYFLHLVTASRKPVVMVGSMPAGRTTTNLLKVHEVGEDPV